MINGALSDLAHLQRQTFEVQRLRATLQTAGTEMVTGVRADLSEDGTGLVGAVFGIDRNIARLDQVTNGLNLAKAEASVAQSAMGLVADAGEQFGIDLAAAIGRDDVTSILILQGEAEQTLDSVVGVLNTQVAGRALFAGTGTDMRAISSAEQIRTDINAIVAAAPDAATAWTDIDTYFNDPGGVFETTIYTGATDDLIGTVLPDGSRTAAPPRADDDAFRSTLAALAGLAAVGSTTFGGSIIEQRAFAQDASGRLFDANRDVVTLRASFGQTEERIIEGLDAAEAEITTLRLARVDVAGRDPYQAATEFSALEGQLQSLFTVTARVSSLTLANFLR